MHLPRWIRSKRPSRKGSTAHQSISQDEEAADMPPPYPHGQLAINYAIAERIEGFMSTIRPRPDREWQLEMLMFPTEAYLSQSVFDNQGWEARISVNVTSLPSLMRSGFHVTERNVRGRRSHFVLDPQDQNPFENPCHVRNYSLKSAGGPGWKAEVGVMASTVRELSQFQIPLCLSAKNIGAAVGFDRSGKRVYNFSAVNSDENFNAIYDDHALGRVVAMVPESASLTGEGLWYGQAFREDAESVG